MAKIPDKEKIKSWLPTDEELQERDDIFKHIYKTSYMDEEDDGIELDDLVKMYEDEEELELDSDQEAEEDSDENMDGKSVVPFSRNPVLPPEYDNQEFKEILKSVISDRLENLKRSRKLENLEFFQSCRKTRETESMHESNVSTPGYSASSRSYQRTRDEVYSGTPKMSFHPNLQPHRLPFHEHNPYYDHGYSSIPPPQMQPTRIDRPYDYFAPVHPYMPPQYRIKMREYEMECANNPPFYYPYGGHSPYGYGQPMYAPPPHHQRYRPALPNPESPHHQRYRPALPSPESPHHQRHHPALPSPESPQDKVLKQRSNNKPHHIPVQKNKPKYPKLKIKDCSVIVEKLPISFKSTKYRNLDLQPANKPFNLKVTAALSVVKPNYFKDKENVRPAIKSKPLAADRQKEDKNSARCEDLDTSTGSLNSPLFGSCLTNIFMSNPYESTSSSDDEVLLNIKKKKQKKRKHALNLPKDHAEDDDEDSDYKCLSPNSNKKRQKRIRYTENTQKFKNLEIKTKQQETEQKKQDQVPAKLVKIDLVADHHKNLKKITENITIAGESKKSSKNIGQKDDTRKTAVDGSVKVTEKSRDTEKKNSKFNDAHEIFKKPDPPKMKKDLKSAGNPGDETFSDAKKSEKKSDQSGKKKAAENSELSETQKSDKKSDQSRMEYNLKTAEKPENKNSTFCDAKKSETKSDQSRKTKEAENSKFSDAQEIFKKPDPPKMQKNSKPAGKSGDKNSTFSDVKKSDTKSDSSRKKKEAENSKFSESDKKSDQSRMKDNLKTAGNPGDKNLKIDTQKIYEKSDLSRTKDNLKIEKTEDKNSSKITEIPQTKSAKPNDTKISLKSSTRPAEANSKVSDESNAKTSGSLKSSKKAEEDLKKSGKSGNSTMKNSESGDLKSDKSKIKDNLTTQSGNHESFSASGGNQRNDSKKHKEHASKSSKPAEESMKMTEKVRDYPAKTSNTSKINDTSSVKSSSSLKTAKSSQESLRDPDKKNLKTEKLKNPEKDSLKHNDSKANLKSSKSLPAKELLKVHEHVAKHSTTIVYPAAEMNSLEASNPSNSKDAKKSKNRDTKPSKLDDAKGTNSKSKFENTNVDPEPAKTAVNVRESDTTINSGKTSDSMTTGRSRRRPPKINQGDDQKQEADKSQSSNSAAGRSGNKSITNETNSSDLKTTQARGDSTNNSKTDAKKSESANQDKGNTSTARSAGNRSSKNSTFTDNQKPSTSRSTREVRKPANSRYLPVIMESDSSLSDSEKAGNSKAAGNLESRRNNGKVNRLDRDRTNSLPVRSFGKSNRTLETSSNTTNCSSNFTRDYANMSENMRQFIKNLEGDSSTTDEEEESSTVPKTSASYAHVVKNGSISAAAAKNTQRANNLRKSHKSASEIAESRARNLERKKKIDALKLKFPRRATFLDSDLSSTDED